MIRIEVKREENESSGNLLRRFSRRVTEASVVKTAKQRQFANRPLSDFKKRKSALKRLAKRAVYARLKKLGQI